MHKPYVKTASNNTADELFSEYLEACYSRSLREDFKRSPLVDQWASEYPDIIDKNDFALASGPQGRSGYHFIEWFAAIVIYKQFGLLSLIGKYECKSHTRKRDVLSRFLADQEIEYITNPKEPFGSTQCPDLFLYKKDFSDFCFCEVKGPRDSLKPNQYKYFKALKKKFGKPLFMLNIKEID